MWFTHMQVHSAYSLLQSPLTIQEIVDNAKARGYSAIALTDTNVMYGVVEFYRQATKAKLKPLLGLHVAVADGEVLLIAETTAGYHQLLKISSAIKLAETLPKLADLPTFKGLAAIVPGAYLLTTAFRDAWGSADDYLAVVQQLAPSDTYLGLTQSELASELAAFAQARQLPLLALGDVQYLDPNDAFLQKTMQAIKAGSLLNQRDPTLMDAGAHWLTPPDQAALPFEQAGLDEALANTQALAKRAQVTIEFKQPQLPHYQTPNAQPAEAYLRELATKGLAKRFKGQAVPEAYTKRLTYELGVITQMGFADYFLVVWDVMNHAHEVNIMTGPGRGSAAGALVSYALAITEVDPIEYHLLFERFLNPARANMPDIDLDIPDNRRGELIQYVHERYGDDHMAQIITFGTFGAKQALRDVCRVFGLSQFDSNKWSAAIPEQFHIDLKTAYEKSQPLKNLVADSEQNRLMFGLATRLEGLPRHDSTHAAGVVLAQEPLSNTVALQTGSDGIAQTQVPMGDVQALGLLKMDFLGLRNLSILATASYWVEKQTGQPFDPKTIPLDDQATLALFARGDTNGVFQFESAGIRRVLRALKPTSFEDVVAVNALYRPGPMENIDTFIARKHGQEPITYPAEALRPILASTYGVLVYQEQVMQVASTLGGFSLGEADLLRQAMSKKKAAVLEKERAAFMQGAAKLGYSTQVATTVYDYIDRFANYGFNRSHAVAYSMIAFWLAYLKTHYPAAFYAALMNTSVANHDKLRVYVQELKARHLPLYAPDINLSKRNFTIENSGIRFGFAMIRGVRRDFVTALLDARQNGPFTSLRDVLRRIDPKWLKAESFAPLVYAGVFDRFDTNRAQTVANLDELIESIRLAGNDVGLFEVLAPKLTKVPELSATDRLDQEAAVLGVYLSGHPVDRYVNALKPFERLTSAQALVVNAQVKVVLVIRRIKRLRTKKGEEMAFVDGQDATGNVSVTVFPRVYPQMRQFEAGQVIVVQGKVENKSGLAILANRVQLAEAAVAALPKGRLFIKLPQDFAQAQEAALLKTLQAHRGPLPVITVAAKTRDTVMLAPAYWVADDAATTAAIAQIMGADNVVLQTNETPRENPQK
ncbi:DNA polymerase III subunit alpha [Lacticaseibacillus jixiensis]|uniref:DNA polymerase III subunit alpha n=1 Tax=Lacticaseibacillus jixiensis TaxID=3231926 RepID=UPI0036F28646